MTDAASKTEGSHTVVRPSVRMHISGKMIYSTAEIAMTLSALEGHSRLQSISSAIFFAYLCIS